MATRSTPHRKSTGRTRGSLGSTKASNLSSPSPSSSQVLTKPPPLPSAQSPNQKPNLGGSTATRKPSFGLPLSVFPPQSGTHNDQGLKAITTPGSSPPAMTPSRPATSRHISDDRNGNQNLEVGDSVDVPGGMYGMIKFIGEVRGKRGTFAGVELAKEWAARGKNDGDVDGIRYFTTSVRGAGIFLPSSKAYKRLSPAPSSGDSIPLTPPTPSMAPNFSKSVGPARVPSPVMKAKRPSLPRPESPMRRAQNAASTPQTRPSIGKPNFSRSMVGRAQYAPSPTPGKLGSSVRGTRDLTGDPGKKLPATPKPAIKNTAGARAPSPSRSNFRSESRLGPEPMFDEESENTPTAVSSGLHTSKPHKKSKPDVDHGEEIKSLRSQLEDRDRQLDAYAADLEEMRNSVAELQTVTPKHNSGTIRSSRGSSLEDLDAASLRALVREKNEKITALTHDFDTHRAEFRDTIDILEHTSDETNRHYEERITTLEDELRSHTNRDVDVESVAQQFVVLEKHVEELEEGLEDSRRGESEARAEVEHLRGEVERGKAELRREREKAATAQKGFGDGTSDARWQREISHRDNEINGLKAIIHSLSRDASSTSPSSPRSSRRSKHNSHNQANGHTDAQIADERQTRERLQREVKDLEELVDRKTYREDELEREIQRLRERNSQLSSISNGATERPITDRSLYHTPDNASFDDTQHQPDASHPQRRPQPAQRTTSNHDSDGDRSTAMTDNSSPWCEMCEAAGHDILHCNFMGSQQPAANSTFPKNSSGTSQPSHATNNRHADLALKPHSNDFPAPLSPARSPVSGSSKEKEWGDAVTRTPKQQQQRPPPASARAKPTPLDNGMVPGKESGVVDESKWCALCERDGHGSVDCPFDDDDDDNVI